MKARVQNFQGFVQRNPLMYLLFIVLAFAACELLLWIAGPTSLAVLAFLIIAIGGPFVAASEIKRGEQCAAQATHLSARQKQIGHLFGRGALILMLCLSVTCIAFMLDLLLQ